MARKEYNTDSRRAVTEFLRKNSMHHFTIEEIIDALASKGENISQSTVYRRISRLYEEGIIHRFEIPGEHRFAYQFCACEEGCHSHFHLKCIKCGKIIHMKCDFLSQAKEHILEEHQFLIENEGFISGMCSDCSMSSCESECGTCMHNNMCDSDKSGKV